MPLEASVTKHASKRICQRLSLTEKKVRKLVDNGYAVNIGTEPGFNRRHMLFFCKPDMAHFVAVQDSMNGAIVTVLPLDYHRNLAWSADEADLKKAEELASYFFPAPFVPLNFRISFCYVDQINRQLVKSAFKWPARPYDGIPNRLFADQAFLRELVIQIDKFEAPSTVYGIIVTLGKSSLRHIFSIEDLAALIN